MPAISPPFFHGLEVSRLRSDPVEHFAQLGPIFGPGAVDLQRPDENFISIVQEVIYHCDLRHQAHCNGIVRRLREKGAERYFRFFRFPLLKKLGSITDSRCRSFQRVGRGMRRNRRKLPNQVTKLTRCGLVVRIPGYAPARLLVRSRRVLARKGFKIVQGFCGHHQRLRCGWELASTEGKVLS